MKIALFLGAGASVQFGNPPTKEFKEQLIENNSIDKRIKPILNLKSLPDIEYVLQCLREILDARNDPLGRFLNNSEFDVVIQSEPKITLTEIYSLGEGPYNQIMQTLFQTYKIEDEVKPTLKKFFEPLFNLISNHSDRIEIGTTNYDLAVENYCNLQGSDYQCVDGFHMDGVSYKWDPKYLNENYEKSGEKFVYLHKIHGSLNWEGKDNALRKYGSIPNFRQEGSASPSTVIAPTLSPKDAYSKQPFSFLLETFSKKLLDSDVCIVIGFSFRDGEISQYFNQFVQNRKHLIIVSPSCFRNYAENLFRRKNDMTDEEVKEWANSHARSENRNVSFIDLPFNGDNNKEVFEKIENKLK